MMEIAAEERGDIRSGLGYDEVVYVKEFCDPG